MTGRIRTIKPEWLEDERLAMTTPEARVMSVALILLADDYGNGRANLTMLGGRVFPAATDPRSSASSALDQLVQLAFVALYEVEGQSYFAIRNWEKHQRVDRPGKPHVPPPIGNKPKNKAEKTRDTHAKIRGTLAKDRGTLATPSRDSRETLATDQRPTTNDQRPPTLDLARAHETAAAPTPTPPHMEAFARSLVATTSADDAVAAVVSETRQAAGGAPFQPSGFQDREAVQKLREWSAAPGIGPDKLRAALVAFWAAKGTGARLSWIVEEDPGRFLGAAPVKNGTYRRAKANHEYVEDLSDFERMIAKAEEAKAAKGGDRG